MKYFISINFKLKYQAFSLILFFPQIIKKEENLYEVRIKKEFIYVYESGKKLPDEACSLEKSLTFIC
jgi:hypothetical protein